MGGFAGDDGISASGADYLWALYRYFKGELEDAFHLEAPRALFSPEENYSDSFLFSMNSRMYMIGSTPRSIASTPSIFFPLSLSGGR